MEQVFQGRLDEVPEFVSPVMLFQPWLVLVSDTATKVELNAVEQAMCAICYERGAYHEAEQAFDWLQRGRAEYAIDWFRYMTGDIGNASSHWGQAATWLKEFGVAERADVYQSLYQYVSVHQQRLNALVERMQGQIARYCQEWGLVLPAAGE